MREAASRSPCVMEVLDAEEVAPTDEERAAGCVAVGFMVMPLYEENLSDLVERARSCGHHLDPMDVICIFIQVTPWLSRIS